MSEPAGWHDIQVGAIVLASAPPRHTEWFECLVIAAEGDEFTVQFCDWPDEPTFTRTRDQLALLNPTHKPHPPLEPTKAEAPPVTEAA